MNVLKRYHPISMNYHSRLPKWPPLSSLVRVHVLTDYYTTARLRQVRGLCYAQQR